MSDAIRPTWLDRHYDLDRAMSVWYTHRHQLHVSVAKKDEYRADYEDAVIAFADHIKHHRRTKASQRRKDNKKKGINEPVHQQPARGVTTTNHGQRRGGGSW